MARTSGDDAEEESNKRMKREEEDDLISDLPDCLIQHILSFLPSTKDSIRTGVLSKRWLNQWTRVPILIFKCPDGMSIEHFFDFVDKSLNLYNCSKINKFIINSPDPYSTVFINNSPSGDLHDKLSKWILFATTRDVKELVLDCDENDGEDDDCSYDYQLPQLLLKNDFLVKLKMCRCIFEPGKGHVNWASLKALHIGSACLPEQGVENVLSGCPVIEYLELRNCYGFQQLSIASKSLKTFCLFGPYGSANEGIEISCPNLQKLKLLSEMWYRSVKLKDLLPSVSATLNFEIGEWGWSDDDKLKCVTELLLHVQHVHELKLGPWFFKILATAKGESSLSLNNKCLTVIDSILVAVHPAIAISFLSCSLLEKLVIHLSCRRKFQHQDFMRMEKKIWELDGSITDRVVSHLKTIEVVGLHHIYSHGSRDDLVKFLEFVLKNGRMLAKIVLVEAEEHGLAFAHEICQKLSCIQKASREAVIRVACLPMSDLRFDYNCNSDWDKIVC